MNVQKLSRRSFLVTGSLTLSAIALVACGQGAEPSPTAAAAPTSAAAASPTSAPQAAPTAVATSAPTTAATPATAATPTTAASTEASGSVPPRPTPVSDKVEIEMLSFYGKGAPDWNEFEWINQQFSKVYSPSVTVKMSQGNQQNSDLRLKNGDPAEIGNVGASYASFVSSIPYLKANYVYNLQDAMKQESWDTKGKSWLDTIVPIAQPLLRVPGYPGIWSFPREVTSLVFFYNKQLFQKAGVEPPKTWTELDQISDKLKKAGITPFTQDGTAAHGYMAWWLWELWSKSIGNDYVRATILGEHSFTEPEFVKGAQMLRDFLDKGYFVQGFEGMDHTGSQIVFYQGQAAMVLVGSWLIGEMANTIPPGFEQDVFRFPMVDGGKGDPLHLFGTVNVLGIAAQSKHPQIGVEWARWFNSVEVNNKRTKDLQWQSAIVGVAPPTEMPQISKVFTESTKMDIFGNGDLVSGTKDAATKFNDTVGKFFSKQIQPADFCKQVDDTFKDFFQKNPDVLKDLQPFIKGAPTS